MAAVIRVAFSRTTLQLFVDNATTAIFPSALHLLYHSAQGKMRPT